MLTCRYVIGDGADRSRHGGQLLRKLIHSRSCDQQPLLRPGHAGVEEFDVLGGLGFRGFDLAEADGKETQDLKIQDKMPSIALGYAGTNPAGE